MYYESYLHFHQLNKSFLLQVVPCSRRSLATFLRSRSCAWTRRTASHSGHTTSARRTSGSARSSGRDKLCNFNVSHLEQLDSMFLKVDAQQSCTWHKMCLIRIMHFICFRQRLGVETLLGLTATAPEGTVRDIARHLGVPEKEGGVIRGKLLPKNLVLSVSKVRWTTE